MTTVPPIYAILRDYNDAGPQETTYHDTAMGAAIQAWREVRSMFAMASADGKVSADYGAVMNPLLKAVHDAVLLGTPIEFDNGPFLFMLYDSNLQDTVFYTLGRTADVVAMANALASRPPSRAGFDGGDGEAGQ